MSVRSYFIFIILYTLFILTLFHWEEKHLEQSIVVPKNIEKRLTDLEMQLNVTDAQAKECSDYIHGIIK